MAAAHDDANTRVFMRAVRARHPRLRRALVADARRTASGRGERDDFRSGLDAALQVLRLMWESDAFLAQALYRTKARLQALGIPMLPGLVHRLAIAIAQVSIGDPVIVEPGVYVVHGQIVIDGMTEIRGGTVIGPFVTIGVRDGVEGPVIERNVRIGTGARVLGAIRIGHGAQIGANAVVIHDVPPNTTVVGIPATPVSDSSSSA